MFIKGDKQEKNLSLLKAVREAKQWQGASKTRYDTLQGMLCMCVEGIAVRESNVPDQPLLGLVVDLEEV